MEKVCAPHVCARAALEQGRFERERELHKFAAVDLRRVVVLPLADRIIVMAVHKMRADMAYTQPRGHCARVMQAEHIDIEPE